MSSSRLGSPAFDQSQWVLVACSTAISGTWQVWQATVPVYQKIMTETEKFGNDIEIAPKNAWVSLRRKKQFALLQPATKTRFEIGIILKRQESQGKLEKINTANAMCSHKINVTDTSDIDDEVINWLRKAYENAG